MTDLLITTEELAALLADPERAPLVLDARWNLVGRDGGEEFADGHVPGARFVRMHGGLAGDAGAGGRHPLPSVDDFAAELRRVGVTSGPVVVMDGGAPLAAARLWWMLTDAGHPDVRVLDGGFAAWRESGGAIATGPDDTGTGGVVPGDFVPVPGQRRLTSIDEVVALATAAGIASPTVVPSGALVDVRAAERFRGDHEPIDAVGGHIPGAINVESSGNFVDGRFRPADELATRFTAAGVDGASVVYCGSGTTACQTLLALELAGITGAGLFVGSWSSWITDPTHPIATA